MKKSRLIIFSFFALLLVVPMTVSAYSVKTDDIIYVGEDEVIEGNLYAAGSSITVDGTVTGDIICGAQTVNINGTIEGDVICAAQTININGPINGNVRAAGNTVNINSTVARNVMAVGASIIVGNNAVIGWGMLTAGATAEIRGKIGRNLHGALASAVITGEIGGDVKLQIDDHAKKDKKDASNLKISDSAIIGGGVFYTAANEAKIASGASIIGDLTHNLPKIKTSKNNLKALWGMLKIYSLFSSLVLGLVIIYLWRDETKKIVDSMLKKTDVSIGWGAVVMFLTPIIATLLLITLIGIPLAGILILVWIIALCVSKIFVGILVGRVILEKIWTKQKDSMMWAMTIGIAATQILFSVPIIGWLLALVAAWWGLGGLFLYTKKS